MGDYDLKQAAGAAKTTPTPAPATATDTAQDTVGNQAVQSQLPGRTDPGRLSYQQALGSTLGNALYDQLESQLTDEKLVQHAQSAVGSATKALATYFKDNAAPSDQEAARLFVQALDGELKRIADQAVRSSGVAGGAKDWAGQNPYAIATAAVAGAVAYVLSNQDIPLLEQKVGLGGGHALLAGVDIGRTMDLALEQVRVGYRYSGGGTVGEVKGDWFKDGGWQVQGKYQQALDPGEQLVLNGLHVDRPGEQRSRVDLNYTNPNMAASAYWERMYGEKKVDAIGGSISTVAKEGELNAYARGEYRTDGSWQGAGGVSKKTEGWGWAVEGYGGQTAQGKSDAGVRAMLNWRF